jgi:hypothetical protein
MDRILAVNVGERNLHGNVIKMKVRAMLKKQKTKNIC